MFEKVFGSSLVGFSAYSIYGIVEQLPALPTWDKIGLTVASTCFAWLLFKYLMHSYASRFRDKDRQIAILENRVLELEEKVRQKSEIITKFLPQPERRVQLADGRIGDSSEQTADSR